MFDITSILKQVEGLDYKKPDDLAKIIAQVPEDLPEDQKGVLLETLGVPTDKTKSILQKIKEAKNPFKKAEKKSQEEKTDIENNTPNDQKPKGLARLVKLILKNKNIILSFIIPYIINQLQKQIDKYKNICPPEDVTIALLVKYNDIVAQVNKLTEQIDKIAKIATATSTGITILSGVASVIRVALPSISTIIKFLPVAPGAATSASDDLAEVKQNILFDKEGNPRIPKIAGNVNSLSLSIALFAATLKSIPPLLLPIEKKLKQCLPDGYTIDELSPTVQQYVNLGTSNYGDLNKSSYNGFDIKIETVPYDATINRYQAVGYNQYGIAMIKGSLSFSPDAQTLVDELKLIIDRDNLKGY